MLRSSSLENAGLPSRRPLYLVPNVFRRHASLRIGALLLGCMVALASAAPLARAQDDDPTAGLLATLKAGNARTAAAAARALGVLLDGAGDSAEASEVVEALIAALSSDDAALREQSATALGRIMNAQGLAALPQALADENPQVALAAARAIAGSLPTTEARALFKEHAESSDSARIACYGALAPLALPEDLEFLLAGLASEQWQVQQHALQGLRLAVDAGAQLDQSAYEQVALVLGCEYLDASQEAIDFFVAQADDETARAVLIGAVDHQGEGSLPGQLDGSWRTRTNALRAITQLGWPATGEALPAAIRQLGDPTTNVQSEARGVLMAVTREGHFSETELCERLLTELEATESLAVQSGILLHLKDGVPPELADRTATAAAAALESSMASDDAWALREDAIALLANLNATGSVAAIAACLNDEIPNVYQGAADALLVLGPQCEEKDRTAAAQAIATVLQNPRDWRNETIAARAAAVFPSDEVLPPLAAGLTHEVLNVREAASETLATLAREGDSQQVGSVRSAIFREMGSSREAYEYGAMVLGATRDPGVLGLLFRVLESDEPRDRVAAALAVAEIASHNEIPPGPLTEALALLATTDVPEVQVAAQQALDALQN